MSGQELLALADRLDEQAIEELQGWCSPTGGPGLRWEHAQGIAAVFACSDALRARAAIAHAIEGEVR